ncbi:MAG: hypothetical protein BGP04_13245 [Rhizobiales bacterium 62-17]|nr:MAG: hypothetical protein BGP04_13245 [Rhizobiales bacterium 62-17]
MRHGIEQDADQQGRDVAVDDVTSRRATPRQDVDRADQGEKPDQHQERAHFRALLRQETQSDRGIDDETAEKHHIDGGMDLLDQAAALAGVALDEIENAVADHHP